jgi:hypothetical protein
MSLVSRRAWFLKFVRSESSLVRRYMVSSFDLYDLATSISGVMKGFEVRGENLIDFRGAWISRSVERVDENRDRYESSDNGGDERRSDFEMSSQNCSTLIFRKERTSLVISGSLDFVGMDRTE